MNQVEMQTTWETQWDTERLKRLKKAIHSSCLDCEADGEDLFEQKTED